MRELTNTEVETLANRPGVRRIAVQNFLLTVTANPDSYCAHANLAMDTRLYRWNAATVRAIQAGIELSERE